MSKRRKPADSSSNIVYYVLRAIRILLVLVPQTGYIHPDEYFQSVEVLAGRVFDVEHSPPWEFNSTSPIRGMAIPYFTTGLSYIFLRNINGLAMEYLSINVVTPYFLLIIPRFIITLLSFLVDYSLVKICNYNNEKFKSRLIILGTSYVVLIYATRTFSNSIELILFAILLYFVCDSQTFSNELVRKREYIKYRYDKSKSLVEKAKFHKLKLYLVSDNYRNCLIISSLTVFGVWNRPTFIAYAIIPIFFWIYRGIDEKRVSVGQFHTRILFFALCSSPAIVFNIIIDSFYYGYITWGEIGMFQITINNFVVTPLNFIKYNVNSMNLEKHGLHPRYLHLLVNIPLLFNVLGLVALQTIAKYIYWAFSGKFHLLPSIKSIKMLMTMSFISPLLILSIFPHQEPRFLIPIVFPLIYLHSDRLLPEIRKLKDNKSNNELFKFWLTINLALVVFYGFLHQGGIYPAVNYLQKDLKFSGRNTEFHIVTSGIYSIPQSLLLQQSSEKLFRYNQHKYAVKKRIFLYEEGSNDLKLRVQQLKSMKQQQHKKYLLGSSSRRGQFEKVAEDNGVTLKEIDRFWPHLSTEALPDFTKYCFNPTVIFYKNCQVLPLWTYLKTISDLCELIIYEID